MTVAEIKSKLPEAEVYELNSASRYIIIVNRNQLSREALDRWGHALQLSKIAAYIIRCDDPSNAIKLLEIKE